MADEYPIQLRAIYTDPDDGTSSWLGDVALSADGFLTVMAVNEDFEDELTPVADEVNGKDVLRVRVPPPPDAPMFQLYSEAYDRSDPLFLVGLKKYAEATYGLTLRTDEELKAERARREYEEQLGEEEEGVD